MELVDTHCHIQEASAQLGGDEFMRQKWTKAGITNPTDLIEEAVQVGVNRLICVGCTLTDSQMAVALAAKDSHCWASIGIHPHEAKYHLQAATLTAFTKLAAEPRVVAIGECGLDYYYNHSPKADQLKILEFQLDLAQKKHLPLIFHVRDAFDDFWPVFDQFPGVSGVIHSFTANQAVLKQSLARGLYIGLNGIMTFTKEAAQLEVAKQVPLQKLLLETDAPFLTPSPYRGTICKPKYVHTTAEFLSNLRQEALIDLASTTTSNARQLFNF